MRAVALLLLLLAGCASAPKKELICAPVNPCGVVCCNDDGKICPPCRFRWTNDDGWEE